MQVNMILNFTSTMVMNMTMDYYTNATESPQTSFQPKLWLASLVINFTLLSVSAWMVINIGTYGIRSGKFRRNKKKTLSEHFMLKILFVTSILIFPRILTTQALLWIGYERGTNEDRQCEDVIDLTVLFYYIALFPVAIFLWLRQRSLYLQPSLIWLYTKPIQILSWGCISFLILSGLGICFLLMIPTDFQSSWNGCRGKTGVDRHSIVRYILTAVLVSGEVALLCLFIYPLHRHKKPELIIKKPICQDTPSNFPSTISTTCSNTEASTDLIVHTRNDLPRKAISTATKNVKQLNRAPPKRNCKNNTRSVKTSKRIHRVMIRSVVAASVCIASDILSLTLVTFFLPSETIRSFRNSFHDINIIINFFAIALSFEAYKNLFFAIVRPFSIVPLSHENDTSSRNSSA